MKKPLALLTALIMLAASLSACTPSAEPSANGSEAAVPPSANGTSITLMATQNWIKEVDEQLFKAFQEETGIEVKVLVTPDNGFEPLLGTSLAGGSDVVDMFMYHAGSKMLSAGIPEIALELSDQPWVSRLEPWAVSSNTVNGRLVGFSTWGVDYEGIIYNRSLFKEKGWTIPATWDELLTLCDTIQASGVTPLYEPINGVWHTEIWLYAITPMLLEADPDAIAKLNANEARLSDYPVLKEALEQIRGLLNHKPAYYTNDGQNEDWYGGYPAMVNRECAMIASYSAYPTELAANGSMDEWGMFPIPVAGNYTGVSNGGGVSKYINKNSRNIDACLKLLDFLARDENLEIYYAGRADLVTASFKDVQSSSPTSATLELLELSKKACPTRMNNDVLYWDPNTYQYMQGFASGELSAEDFLKAMDDYRTGMFETAAG